MADKTYVVTAPMVIATTDDGRAVDVRRGAPVPSNVTAEWLDLALERKLVAEGQQEGGLVIRRGDGTPLDADPDDRDGSTGDLDAEDQSSGKSSSRSASKAPDKAT